MTLKEAQAYFSQASFTEVSNQIYLFDQSNVLLFRRLKAPHSLLVSGVGGKIEKGESLFASAQRELKEETGLDVRQEDLSLKGALFVHFSANDMWMKGYIFSAQTWSGSLRPCCREGEAFWCPLNEIPWQDMWGDEKLWLPALTLGAFFQAYFIRDEKDIIRHFLVLQNSPLNKDHKLS